MKTRSRMIAALLTIAAVTCAPRASAAASNIDLPALRSYVEFPSLALSPGGTRVAVVVERQNFKTNRYDRHIEVIDCVTRAATAVTPNLSGLSAPAWSPDGLRVAYITDAPDGASQVFAVPARGGPARRLTHAPRGVETFAWRPDGSAIAYVTADAAPNEKAIAAGLDAFEVGDQDYLSVAKPTPSHLWLQSVAGGAPRRLTSGPHSLPRGELIFPLPEVAPMPFFAWAPDGKSIVFARMDNAYNSDAVGTVTHVLDVATGALRKLTSHHRLEAGGSYSPDGTRIAYAYARDDNPLAQAVMMIAPATGGDGIAATQTLDVNALGAHWLTGHRLLVNAFLGPHSRLFIAGEHGDATRVDTGPVDPVPGVIDAAPAGRIAFAASEPQRATEVYYMASPFSAPARLTDYNAPLDARTQSKVAALTWKGPDGFAESGVLFYPPNFDRSKKYPLVLQVHGGPVETSIASWRDTDWPGLPQYIASHGYLVFSPNYRGSDGQGNAYQLAIFNDAGDGPGRDVMAGVEAVKRLGNVDETRIAVSGWSYGGFMTEWLITHYDVWKAAVAGAAPADSFVDYSTSDYNVLGRFGFGGSPWDSAALLQAYRDQSPLSYVDKAKAPTLLLHDSGDVRVPVVHSYEFYQGLKARGVPVSFVVYPVAGHYPADPVRSEDVYRRWLAWLDRYLK